MLWETDTPHGKGGEKMYELGIHGKRYPKKDWDAAQGNCSQNIIGRIYQLGGGGIQNKGGRE